MAEGAVVPYLDIPLQHAHPDVLKMMKRPAASEKTMERIKKWREICPEIVIRSTFIVGFPGETEEHFQYLLDFLKEARLDRVGCFTYSAVDGAPANALENPVPEDVKEARLARFMDVQAQISAEKLQEKVGQEMDILIDHAGPDGAIGRTKGDAPEIDGEVHLLDVTGLEPGQIVRGRIIEADDHDLWAELV
jgi:ribosomal protein S12 methylthiotransferase